jgi:hypothetical protein
VLLALNHFWVDVQSRHFYNAVMLGTIINNAVEMHLILPSILMQKVVNAPSQSWCQRLGVCVSLFEMEGEAVLNSEDSKETMTLGIPFNSCDTTLCITQVTLIVVGDLAFFVDALGKHGTCGYWSIYCLLKHPEWQTRDHQNRGEWRKTDMVDERTKIKDITERASKYVSVEHHQLNEILAEKEVKDYNKEVEDFKNVVCYAKLAVGVRQTRITDVQELDRFAG